MKNYSKFFLIVSCLFLVMSACKKDEEQKEQPIAINLPTELSLKYGVEQDLSIPAELANIDLKLDFTENTNINLNSTTKLQDRLKEAIILDRKSGKIHVNTKLLYPNGGKSAENNETLPDTYKIKVVAGSDATNMKGEQTLALTISPATFSIEELDNSPAIAFGYVLYSKQTSELTLNADEIPTSGTTWSLNAQSAAAFTTLKGNKVEFSATAGDPAKNEEKTYDLVASLKKDGFDIATRSFRITFIPQIKFFYGTYYPEYDLTILSNNLHIALSNGYRSAAPVFSPEKYKSTFSIVEIEKDGIKFDDSNKIITVDEKTGVVIVVKNTTLTAGSYKVTVKAISTTGLEFTTTLTLNMSKLED